MLQVIESKRLILRQLRPSDAQDIFNYMSKKANFPYVEMPIYETLSQAEVYIEKMNQGIEEDKWVIWAICVQDKIIGTLSIWNINRALKTAELGYGLFPAYRGHGFMAEAIREGLNYAFETMDLICIEAYTSVDNAPSRHLLEKLSFDYIHTIEDEYQNNKLMAVYQKKNEI